MTGRDSQAQRPNVRAEQQPTRAPLPFDPKDREHWRELAKPVRLLTYGGGEPWGAWFVQCAKPWRINVLPATREGRGA